MPNVDHGRRELRFKIVYYGPGLGGKTTNLEHIHGHSKAETRGRLVALNDASERTLFFDLLPMELGQYRGYTVRVHLCTVPGQIAADHVRKLVLRSVDGIVMVVDSQVARLDENRQSIRNLEQNLRLLGEDPQKLPLVVQYNKRDLVNAASVATLRQVLGVPAGVPQVEAVANQGRGVFETFKAILRGCLNLVGEPSKAPGGRIPSIVPGRHVSMFPDAEAPTLQRISVPPPPRAPVAAESQAPEPSRPGTRRVVGAG
jgi:signal recognition particle receptor subunit beta